MKVKSNALTNDVEELASLKYGNVFSFIENSHEDLCMVVNMGTNQVSNEIEIVSLQTGQGRLIDDNLEIYPVLGYFQAE